MKRIGILTHFHGSINYGGVLQACAMCRVLEKMGFAPEQIRFSMESPHRRTVWETVCKLLNPVLVISFVKDKIKAFWRSKRLRGRRQAFGDFNRQYVPSSEAVYDSSAIKACGDLYDGFITGSDQVWNPEYYFGAYFLDFAPAGKPKLSYAASIGKKTLTAEFADRIRGHLKEFTAVSLRERDAVALVQPLTELPVEQVLDPTLLLDREQWDSMCSGPLVEQPYLFCFFLGHAPKARALAREYARKNGLKIVTIPHASSLYVRGGSSWGDVRLWNASPADFLSLVKNARCVFTDSFHACAFSTVFQKEFFVFQRAGHAGMSGRIESLLAMLSCQEHFCDTEDKLCLSYMEAQRPVDYRIGEERLSPLRDVSLEFLERSLASLRETCDGAL